MKILNTEIKVPVQLFTLIAHAMKYIDVNYLEEAEIEYTVLYLDKRKFEDGLPMSYLMQIHDFLQIRSDVEAALICRYNQGGTTFAMHIEVTGGFAHLKFTEAGVVIGLETE